MLLPPAMSGRCVLAIAKEAVTDARTRLRSASGLVERSGTRERWNETTGPSLSRPIGGGRSARHIQYAVLFLVLSLIAGALGLTKVSVVAKHISPVLFALLFLVLLAL